MLKQYFIELYKLRSTKKLTERDINIFIRDMNLTISAIRKMIEQKVGEYIDKTNK